MTKGAVPFRLQTNRMSYLIPGGAMIDRFLGVPEGENPMASQMWIASTVQSALKGAKDGCSYLMEEDGGEAFPEVLNRNPQGCLGKEFAEVYGATTGFLLKLLNSRDRLLVQVHPDKEKAKKYFGMPFGKTEAWYVLDTEENEKAYIWAGFQPGVTKEKLRQLIEKQDCEEILRQLHRFEIHKGNVIFIEAGLPHAMGSNSLVAEIQEPVDITLRAERFRPDGSELPVESLHSGIGMDGLLDCFQFQCQSREATRERIFVKSESREVQGAKEEVLIGRELTSCFAMSKITVRERAVRENREFVVGLVLSGEGRLETPERNLDLKKGMEFFVPADVREYSYTSAGEEEFCLLECYPPMV